MQPTKLIVAVACFFPLPILAATVTGQATCLAPGQTVTEAVPDCVAGVPYIGTGASSAVVDSVNSLQISLAVNSTFASYESGATSSSLTIQVSMTLETSGPIRPGYFGVIADGGGIGDAGLAYGGGFAQIGPVSISCPVGDLSYGLCTAYGGTPWVYAAQSGAIFPITLGAGGDELTFVFSASMYSVASQIDGDNSADLLADFGFQAFEADGVTPVALSEVITPEPGSLVPVSILCLAAIVSASKRRRSVASPRS